MCDIVVGSKRVDGDKFDNNKTRNNSDCGSKTRNIPREDFRDAYVADIIIKYVAFPTVRCGNFSISVNFVYEHEYPIIAHDCGNCSKFIVLEKLSRYLYLSDFTIYIEDYFIKLILFIKLINLFFSINDLVLRLKRIIELID